MYEFHPKVLRMPINGYLTQFLLLSCSELQTLWVVREEVQIFSDQPFPTPTTCTHPIQLIQFTYSNSKTVIRWNIWRKSCQEEIFTYINTFKPQGPFVKAWSCDVTFYRYLFNARYFIPVTIENRTCDISSATIGTLFLCCVRVWTKIQERCCLFCFGTSVLCMQRKSRNFCINNNTHDARREKASKTGESSKIERMIG